ncbi:D-tyrosyl-tRNA(Tyr) deacylase [Paracoccus sp. S-4012]|uniref:D-aminoacyl-tRNA deacylase n=1 Tax=Paracoccus sp. S-4012 TaxID=2665648 RepID=UPI0012B10C6B|nr:D-aminoacyl-tRNA deacylase [Paracoccus sp. S-4012]MRX49542.1 D-tyrosyl-tRNA(Tyr) deacylase [Paracoccus sp. S-4012]
MRVLLQRVSEARVTVEGRVTGKIGPGLLALVCAMPGDRPEDAAKMAARVAKLRIFRDEAGRMNLPVTEAGNAILAVSQFTLAADLRTGNRPGFSRAAPPEEAEARYEDFCAALRDLGITVATGEFAAEMQVALVNDGPVTIWMDSS